MSATANPCQALVRRRPTPGEKCWQRERERERERRRDEELEAAAAGAEAEAEEMRATLAQLRSALDASEGQLRDNERQRADLRKALDDARQRYEKLARDVKATQAKLGGGGGGGGGSSRPSTDSARSGAGPGGDTMYLKTILLQFLEQRDGRLRAQLVPVLGKLLKFDK